MSFTTAEAGMINPALKTLTRILCRVHDGELARIPARGPLIVVGNHINFLEVPLLYTHLLPRPITGFAKAETWDNPLLRPLFNYWKGIPIHRGELDRNALRLALQALQAGSILGVAPEGTRSGDGRLQRGHPGVVKIAQMSGAPLLAVAYYGNEKLYANLRGLRRTDFYIRVGRPFRLKTTSRMEREARQLITDEIMHQIAALLPAAYRGVYADLDSATMRYLEYV
jgi:1-acyl-sn-glycerol-3-phosphate acyltransferase